MSKEERLYNLLPAVYRQKDHDEGQPLRALMAVIEEEMKAIESDIEGLYENWFIETCQEWVLPYIGDLLGMRPLRQTSAGGYSHRAHVANTQGYRRRKGTNYVLEQAARDATGWPVKAREFFTLLATTQNINHVRHSSLATVNLKDARQLELLNGPFETAAHTAEVGLISNGYNRYNIKNIGLFFWRLQSYAVTKSDASKSKDGCYWFSPLGIDMPLFNRPQAEQEMTHLTEEINVPGMLRMRAIYDEIESLHRSLENDGDIQGTYFGEDPVFQVFLDGEPVLPEEMVICSLKDWQAMGWKPPGCQEYKRKTRGKVESYKCKVAVDPELGRLALLKGAPSRENEKGPLVQVSYSYGFSGEIGGGPYNRIDHLRKWIDFSGWDRLKDNKLNKNCGVIILEVPREAKSINEALSLWKKYAESRKDTIGIIIITNSSSIESSSIAPVHFVMPTDSKLAVIAAVWPKSSDEKWMIENLEPDGLLPHLKADLLIEGKASSELILDGLLIDGKIELSSSIGRLRLSDCTLVPKKGGLAVKKSADGTGIEIQSCITGPIKLESKFSRLEICESIIDGQGADAISGKYSELKLSASTVLGKTVVLALQAENSIFTEKVRAERGQAGCIRFCCLPFDSITPRRYRCQPDKALKQVEKPEEREAILKRMVATFTSIHYGHPGYGQLSACTPEEILRGSEDGSENGAFSSKKQPQREADLRDCMDEYLPIGLNAGIFYVD
ncbi:MAG: hypothetical protein PHW87_00590 [Methanothrix sp.]|nr:hypothetical protein [Methanothrix sp.]